MAQTIEFSYTAGNTISVEVFLKDSDTIIDTQTATEQTNREGIYIASFSTSTMTIDAHRYVGFVGGTAVVTDMVDITANDGAFLGRSESINASDIVSIAGSALAATMLALSAAEIIPGTVEDATTTPTTVLFAAADITEITANHYNDRTIIFTSGVLQGQVTKIESYQLSSGEGNFTVTAMTEPPGDGDTFIIV